MREHISEIPWLPMCVQDLLFTLSKVNGVHPIVSQPLQCLSTISFCSQVRILLIMLPLNFTVEIILKDYPDIDLYVWGLLEPPATSVFVHHLLLFPSKDPFDHVTTEFHGWNNSQIEVYNRHFTPWGHGKFQHLARLTSPLSNLSEILSGCCPVFQ